MLEIFGPEASTLSGRTSVFEELIKQGVYDKEKLINAVQEADMLPLNKMRATRQIKELEGIALQKYLWNMLLAREGLSVNQKTVYRKQILT